MLRITSSFLGVLLLLAIAFSGNCLAALTSPQVGWQAELTGQFHNVGGTVTILDDDTVQVDDFTYDGGGIVVYFYLGETDSHEAFADEHALAIGDDLFGTVYDGTQGPLVIDLPSGDTLEGYHAISVWCVAVGIRFGSGTFMDVTPTTADFDGDGDVDGEDYLIWQRGMGNGSSLSEGDANGDTKVDAADLAVWEEQFGSVATLQSIPEPVTCILFGILLLPVGALRLRLQ